MKIAARRAPHEPVRAATAGALFRSAGLAAGFLVAVYLGRLTTMDGTGLSLVYPGAGIAVLWFAVQRRSRTFWWDLSALSLITLAVTALTSAPVPVTCFTLANVVQVLVCHRLFGRWCPQLWGAGGSDPMTTVRQLFLLLAATTMASGAGALTGATAVGMVTGSWSWLAATIWWTCNTVSILLIATAGLRVGLTISERRARRPVVPMPARSRGAVPVIAHGWWRGVELMTLVCCSASTLVLVFRLLDLPIAFLALVMTAWAALRFGTTVAVLHDLVLGVVVLFFTLAGNGPFSHIADDHVRALTAHAFVGVLVVTGLALALGRDMQGRLMALVREQAAEAGTEAARIRVVAGLSRAMADAQDPRAALAEAVRQLTGADGVSLMEPAPGGGIRSTALAGDVALAHLDLTEATSPIGTVLATGETCFIADLAADARVGLDAESAAWVPVANQSGIVTGVIGVFYRQRTDALPPTVGALLDALARDAAATIEREELLDLVARHGDHDPLTKLPGRRQWDETLTLELARAERNGQPLTLVVVNLDEMRTYNRERGRAAGDALLRQFGEAALSAMRCGDIIARVSPDVFAVALLNCGLTGAAEVAHRLHGLVPAGRTATVGITAVHNGMDARTAMVFALQALQAGKDSGRDLTYINSHGVMTYEDLSA